MRGRRTLIAEWATQWVLSSWKNDDDDDDDDDEIAYFTVRWKLES